MANSLNLSQSKYAIVGGGLMGRLLALALAKGGTFRKSANGVAQRGLTKGTQVKMQKGGMC